VRSHSHLYVPRSAPQSFIIPYVRLRIEYENGWLRVHLLLAGASTPTSGFIQHRDKDGESLSYTHLRAVKLGQTFRPGLHHFVIIRTKTVRFQSKLSIYVSLLVVNG
jgi:hypothetical protein